MKMFVPACGFQIRLTQDWKFDLYYERRNSEMLQALGHIKDFSYQESYEDYDNPLTCKIKTFEVIIPSQTVLEVDRVFIRQNSKAAKSGEDDFDSLTFKILSSPDNQLMTSPIDGKQRVGSFKHRFWAKLQDVNRIEFETGDDLIDSREKWREKRVIPKMKAEKAFETVIDAFYGRDGKGAKLAPNFLEQAQKFYDELRVISEHKLHAGHELHWYVQCLFRVDYYGRGKRKVHSARRSDGKMVRTVDALPWVDLTRQDPTDWVETKVVREVPIPDWKLVVTMNADDTDVERVELIKLDHV